MNFPSLRAAIARFGTFAAACTAAARPPVGPIACTLGALALLLAAACQQPAHAHEQNAVREAVSTGRYKPLADILEIVEKQMPGRILEVDLELDRLRGPIYEVELLDNNNRKRELTIHAETGQLLELDDVPIIETQPLPLAQLLQSLLERHPGYIEEAELGPLTGQEAAYDVKIITEDGQRMNVMVDAITGQTLQNIPLNAQDVQRITPLPVLLDRTLQQYPGTVLDVELEHHDKPGQSPWYYDIEIRTQDGSILTLHVDVYSGAILSKKKKE